MTVTRTWIFCILSFLWIMVTHPVYSNPPEPVDLWGDMDAAEEAVSISDPLEPLNRLMFTVNDKLYFWVLKPVAQGYSAWVPEGGRIAVDNFFHNLAMPVHFVNALLQGKIGQAATEVGRFGLNTVFGLFGLFDVADEHFNMKSADEDFGQTLGHYGLGEGCYIVWPLFGPSSLRDSVGLVADAYVHPLSYEPEHENDRLALRAFDQENGVSLKIGLYEGIKKDAIDDPYLALRDFWVQNRRARVSE
ncbi:MAG: VacJ family lipoprotein [Magnetococcales bacterium]|nr:VacJ family lipoprotein [Magnetococcales bacterium]